MHSGWGRGLWLGTVVVAGAVAVTANQRPARACGGFFCDSGPQPMPVDQTGENILFTITPPEGGEGPPTTEAHIQIQFTGDAPKFAWVIPVQTPPTFAIGSQLLFDELLRSTVPTYTATTLQTCSPPFAGGGGNAGGSSGGSSGATGGVTVVSRTQVGAFEATVIQGDDGDAVWAWLSDNGYQQPPTARPILDDYVASGHLFAALKLVGGAGVDELHPIVMRFVGQPCVPLKLTAVASVPNMGVRVFFLGDRRVVPVGFAHVTLNEARVNHNNAPGSNYRSVLSAAVDDPAAGGNGFVTEYAGTSDVAQPALVHSPTLQASLFAGATPQDAFELLVQQGVVTCGSGGGFSGTTSSGFGGQGNCGARHPLITPILEQFIPPPAGTTDPWAFWSCLACNAGQVNTQAWDATAFTALLEERIIAPGNHAARLLSSNPYLTRMFTTLDPLEMKSDPEFVAWPQALPDVSAAHAFTREPFCTENTEVVLPDGRVVLVRDGTWPAFEGMPSAEKVELFTLQGERQTLADRRATIDAQLSAWNAALQVGNSSTSSGGNPELPPPPDPDSADDNDDGLDDACACARPVTGPVGLMGWAALGLLVVAGRRRR